MPEATKSKLPPNARKKGGAMFPRVNLENSVEYARKLVSKTHIGPQPASTILAGVFGASSSRGEVRASALKQFGLMEGKSTAYTASLLARQIAVAPDEELPKLYRQAFLTPKVFRTLFETFHGDTITLGRLRQQAAQAGVHPDELDNCVRLFVESVMFAQLGTEEGDSLKLRSAADIPTEVARATADEKVGEPEEPLQITSPNDVIAEGDKAIEQSHASARSVIHVNVTIDSSLDTDKLEKQLSLLRKYGAI